MKALDEPRLEMMQIGNLRMRVATQGSGPMVLLCHGTPECWHSWRHQMAALAAAGYRAVAPDLRGCAGTEAPAEIAQCTLLNYVGDMVELVKTLAGDEDGGRAVIVGHDFGATVAWYSALLRPDLFRAVAGLTIPFTPPPLIDHLTALEREGITHCYLHYLEKPGVAEAELEADVAATFRRLLYTMSGDGPGTTVLGIMEPGAGLLDPTVDPEVLPPWLLQEDLEYVVGEYQRTGFQGCLAVYRTYRTYTALLAPWRGGVIQQPSLFMAGTRDDLLRSPGFPERIQRLRKMLPGLRGCHLLEGAGHWIQRERVDAVNGLLLDFLRSL